MKNLIRFRGLNVNRAWHHLVERMLAKFASLTRIVAAEVVLEKHQDLAPSYRVEFNLDVPGPRIQGCASDHTLLAAIHKAAASIEHQIRGRHLKLSARHKRKMQPILIPTRFEGGRGSRRG